MDEITINDRIFQITRPFAEGHRCTAAEAKVLNQKFHSNIRKNFSRIMDSMHVDDSTMSEVRKAFDHYVDHYSFGGPTPVDIEAWVLAQSIVHHHIKASGRVLGDYSKSELFTQASALLNSPLRDDIYIQAEARTKAIQAAAAKGGFV